MADPVTAMIGVSLVGNYVSGKNAQSAANTQADATANAANLQSQTAANQLALQKQMYDQGTARNEPWYQAGQTALGQLNSGMQTGGKFNSTYQPSALYADPSYQWRLGQGQKALEQSAAAKGIQFSGGTLAGVSDYAQNTASQEYQNQFNRNQTDLTNQYNRLAGVSQLGQNSANNIASQGSQMANTSANIANTSAQNIGNLGISGANAQAAGQMAYGNIIPNSVNQGLQLYGYGQTQGWFNQTPDPSTTVPAGSGFSAPSGFSLG
jgi:hypothetical protein